MKTIKALGMILVLVFAATAQSDKVVRVRFPKGGTAVELSGTLRGAAATVYLVRASKGQRMSVHLSVAEDEYASLQIRQPNGRTLTNADGEDASLDFENTLPMTGDYRIIVFPPDTADRTDTARYRLSISIEN